MSNWFKKKQPVPKELYPGVPTTDGTNDFLVLYSNISTKEVKDILAIQKQQVVEKALDLTLTSYSTYKYNLLIDDIKHLSYSIKAIEILLRLNK